MGTESPTVLVMTKLHPVCHKQYYTTMHSSTGGDHRLWQDTSISILIDERVE